MKRRSMHTVLSVALAAAMTLGNVPVTALAVTGSQTAADGTQTASATVISDDPTSEDPDGWDDYDISVALTVANGKISNITVTPGAGYISDDASYVARATTKSNGIKTKLEGQAATYDTVNSWDTVSGATHVSEAIKSAALTAISQFDEVVTVDKSALQSAVDAASALSQGNYTDESWSAFTSALDAAKTVLNNSDASQDDVNNAVSALSSAQEGLTEKATVNKDALSSAIEAAAALKEEDYTAETWSAFASALEAAQTVYANDAATQDEVDKAVTDLATAQGALAEKEDEDVYVLMNIPYADFYKAVGAGDVDVTSSATGKIRNSGLAGATYNGGGEATNTTDVTDVTKGVQFPVKVSESLLADSKYTEVTDSTSYNIAYLVHGQAREATLSGKDAMIQADDYAYYKLSETPANYVELTADGFSAVQGGVTQVTETSDITYASHWGTYQLDLDGISGKVAAVVVKTDKLTFGLKPTDHIWRSMEIAWSPENGLEATNGATLESLTVYTDEGVYEIAVNQKLKSLSSAEISASLTDNTGTVTGLPDDIADAKASVSYTEGSGRDAKTTTYVTDAAITDGKFTLPEDVTLEKDKEYTVTVSSSNYVNLSAKATYSQDVYVLMNIPYSEFYKLVGAGDVDVTSAATTKVRINDRAGGSYNGGGEVQSDDTSKGVQSKGVQFPVKISEELLKDSKYTEVTDDTSIVVSYIAHGQSASETLTGKDAMIQEDDYAYYKLSDTPANYVELTSDGFSTVQGDVQKADASGVDIEYGSYWGTYEIDLPKSDTPAGAVVVKTDKLTFGLKPTQHFWKYHELAWTPTDGLEATNGATVESVTVYSTNGVVEYDLNTKLEKKLFSETADATLVGDTGTIGDLPDDIADAKVSVSYTEGKGRHATEVSVISNADINADGSFTIPSDPGLEVGKEYTVSVSSSNYVDISATATYSDVQYVLMNIPYSEFYKLVGAGDVDVTSSATAKVRNAGVAGATYNGGGNATNTTDVTDKTKGVQFAVKVTDSKLLEDAKYTQVTYKTSYDIAYSGRGRTTNATVKGKDALIQADDYAYYKIGEIPANYFELTAGGLSQLKGNVTKIDDSASPSITYGGHWGTYQYDFPDGISGRVAAVKVTTDKLTFGLKPTDYIWRSMEIAWTPKDDLAASNGATLESVTIYTSDAVYEINVNQALTKKYFDGSVSASLDNDTGTVTGLPDDIDEAKVTVSYTEGQGRGATTTKVIDSADITDGKFTIPDDAGLENGKEYTVTVSSSNYVDLSAKATYSDSLYVLMNIPYSEFYKLVGAGDVDVTSAATTKVRINDRAGGSYNGGGEVQSDDTSKGVQSKGVQFPVKVSAKLLKDSKYTEVTDDTSIAVSYIAHGQSASETLTGKDAMIQEDDYAYYKLSETPSNYVELTSDGFSAVQGDVQKGDASEVDVEYGTRWGTYEIDLPSSDTPAGAVVVKTDKLTFGLKPTQHFWKYHELAWTPTNGLEATNGATVESVTVYSTNGVVEYDLNKKLEKSLYSGSITATLSGNTGTISGVPDDITDAKVTVSYTEGSGRNAKTTKVVENAEINDGKFVIPEDANLEDGKTYDVTVTGGNYVDMKTTAIYHKAYHEIKVVNLPTKTTYTVGEKFDPTGIKITVDGQEIALDDLNYTIPDDFDTLSESTILNDGSEEKVIMFTYGDSSIGVTVTVKPVEYTATTTYETENQTSFVKNVDKKLVVTSNADREKFVAVYVDGSEVNADNYTVTERGTIVTFKPDYVNSLSVGEHKVTILSSDGKGTTTVKVSTKSSETSDNSSTGTTKSGTSGSSSGSSGSSSGSSGSSSGSSGGSSGSSGSSSGSSTSSSQSAKTGDYAQTTLWVTVTVIVAAALILLIVRKKRSR